MDIKKSTSNTNADSFFKHYVEEHDNKQIVQFLNTYRKTHNTYLYCCLLVDLCNTCGSDRYDKIMTIFREEQ
jgi:hypothetical protein